MWGAESCKCCVKFIQTLCARCRWGLLHEDAGRDEGSCVIYQSAGHATTQECEEFLGGWFGKVVQGIDAPVNGDGVQVRVETIVDQKGTDGNYIDNDPFIGEV